MMNHLSARGPGSKFKGSLEKWVKECAKDDEACVVVFDKHNDEYVPTRVELSQRCPEWKCAEAEASRSTIVGLSAWQLDQVPFLALILYVFICFPCGCLN
jgi:hypothetical protein